MKKTDGLFRIATVLIAVVLSFTLAFIIILFVSKDPMNAITTLLIGPIKSLRNFGNIVELMTTFMFTGLSISIMFSAGQFNVSAEGAFFMGALFSAGVASTSTMPVVPTVLLSILAGIAGGVIITSIPGLLKSWLGASELVSSLMINYVALYFGLYLLNTKLRDPTFGMLGTHQIANEYRFTVLIAGTRIHFGIIIACLLIIAFSVFLYKTKTGYNIRVVGQNTQFAKYIGISVPVVIMLAQILGGVIVGIGGASEMLGMYKRFQWTSLPQYGWDGVIVAILANKKPQYVPLSAFFLAYIRIGSDLMARATDVPTELITIIQAVIILLISASALLESFKQKAVVKEAMGNA